MLLYNNNIPTYNIGSKIILSQDDMSVLYTFFKSHLQNSSFTESIAIATAISHILKNQPELRAKINDDYQNNQNSQYTDKLFDLNQIVQDKKNSLDLSPTNQNKLNDFKIALKEYDLSCSEAILDYFKNEDILQITKEAIEKYETDAQIEKTSTIKQSSSS